jgi:hypothetical protein
VGGGRVEVGAVGQNLLEAHLIAGFETVWTSQDPCGEHGVSVQAQPARDRRDRCPFRVQRGDRLVALPGPGHDPQLPHRRHGVCGVLAGGVLLGGRRRGLVGMREFTPLAAVCKHAALEVSGQVLP